jgi:hypothetical protein
MFFGYIAADVTGKRTCTAKSGKHTFKFAALPTPLQ